jgi:hypothetical protein
MPTGGARTVPPRPAWLWPETRRQFVAWFVAATIIFSGFTAWCFWGFFRGGLSVVAPLEHWGKAAETVPLRGWDQRYAIWATVRNARAFLSPGQPFFDAGQCYPAHDSLALGHGVFVLGFLGIPATILSGDPLVVYNIVLLTLALTAPLAMYALVTDWTGLPVAGIVGGLIYGFHAAKLGDPDHLYVTDTVWTVLMLFFLRRALRDGNRFRCAVGFAFCVVGQLGADLYPAMGSVFVGALVLVGLVLENKMTKRLAVPALVATLIIVVFSYEMYAPYFLLKKSGVVVERHRIFLALSALLPGGGLFPGWIAVLLAAVGSLGLRRPATPNGVPSRSVCLALLVAFCGISFLAMGGVFSVEAGRVWQREHSGTVAALPLEPSAAYEWLAGWMPGLNIGRAPAYMYGAAHVCVSVLAGLGCATVLTALLAGRRRSQAVGFAAASLVVLSAITVALTAPRFFMMRQRPAEEELAFFRELAKKQNNGPILELPLVDEIAWWDRASESLLLAAYHRRPTSECFASFVVSSLPDSVRDAITTLPAPEALHAIRAAGFTTILVHHDGGGRGYAEPFEAAARNGGTGLTKVSATATRTAFAIQSD